MHNWDFNNINNYLRLFRDIASACPYGLGDFAVFRQHLFSWLPDPLFHKFLDIGFRRNGNNLYTMVCPDCSKCLPIKIDPYEFKSSRNQKRVWQKNSDFEVSMGRLRITEEKLKLCKRFFDARFPDTYNNPLDYYGFFFTNTITNTLEIEFRRQGRLIGSSIVDLGAEWINAVYFYFDPLEARRSPGTYNILYLIEFCKHKGIRFLYLGYLIRELKSMAYKAKFRPYYILNGKSGKWEMEK
ncbi:MAG: arginyltransferase [Thermodesulfobacteriota bacterium]